MHTRSGLLVTRDLRKSLQDRSPITDTFWEMGFEVVYCLAPRSAELGFLFFFEDETAPLSAFLSFVFLLCSLLLGSPVTL